MKQFRRRAAPQVSGFPSRAQLRAIKRCLGLPPRDSGISGQRWSVGRIHRLLRKRFGVKLSARYALRCLRKAGITVKFVRAREPALNANALVRLRRALQRPPAAAGIEGERWSRARIAKLIERRFGKRLSSAHAARLARQLRQQGLGSARDRRLSDAQGRELRESLMSQIAHGGQPPLTRAQLSALIENRFAVRYHPQSIPGVLKRWNIACALVPSVRGDPRPNPEQLLELASALQGSPVAAGIRAPRWEQRHIAHFLAQRFSLRYPAKGMYRRLARWGVPVASPANAGGACALNDTQRQALADALTKPPGQFGYTESRWSRTLVARFVLEQFDVRYQISSIPHVLRRAGLKLRSTRSEIPPTDPPAFTAEGERTLPDRLENASMAPRPLSGALAYPDVAQLADAAIACPLGARPRVTTQGSGGNLYPTDAGKAHAAESHRETPEAAISLHPLNSRSAPSKPAD